MKPNMVRNIFLRVFSFCIILFLLRFTFILFYNGAFFFSITSIPSSSSWFSLSPSLSSFSSSSSLTHSSYLTINNPPPNFRTSLDYEFYTSIFQEFIFNGFLLPNSSTFCLSNSHIVALNDVGIHNSFSFFSKVSSLHLPFSNHSFHFMFFDEFNHHSSILLSGFASEIERTLRPSGVLVILIETKDFYALHSILELFDFCKIVRIRDIPGPNPVFPSIREIILRKSIKKIHHFDKKVDQCSVTGFKIQLIKQLEPLITKEPLKPWITLKRNMKNVKYLPSLVDISFKPRYAYVDVGARNYGSSIGSWFKKRYPKQNKHFEVYAIEADKEFHGEYRAKKGVTLLPFAAWVKNETLFFEINRVPTKRNEEYRGMGRIQSVQSSSNYMLNVDKIKGFDFAEWLKGEFKEKDYVVMKMDVEGTEFHLIPRMIETGAICLVDEIFLECHYNTWQKCCPGVRSPKYDKTYSQCIHLFYSLRKRGVVVHQWW